MTRHRDTRGSAASRGYNASWRKARLAYLRHHPLCVMCAQRGDTTAATVVDHIQPHKGNSRLFWQQDNWQPLCAPCHDGPKRAAEQSGVLRGCDERGFPLDPIKRAEWIAGGNV